MKIKLVEGGCYEKDCVAADNSRYPGCTDP
jgi:hypothetical protein